MSFHMLCDQIHLELVTQASKNAFVTTLQRSVARCGNPKDIYSDCDTNLVGANLELRYFMK